MDNTTFLRVIVRARLGQLYYHHCHNLTSGLTFSSDHAMFADFYGRLEDDYDTLAEYLIAISGNSSFNTNLINQSICDELGKIKIENMTPEQMFMYGLELEHNFYSDLTDLDREASLGLRNAIGDICQAIDNRVYKIQQRLK